MSESDSLFDEFDQLVDRIDARLTEASPHNDREHHIPPVDVVETPTEFVVLVDLPGIEPESVVARVTDNILHVAATPDESLDPADPGATVLRREREVETVSRRIALPQEVDESESTADYTAGVLTVRLSKDEEEQPGHYLDVE